MVECSCTVDRGVQTILNQKARKSLKTTRIFATVIVVLGALTVILNLVDMFESGGDFSIYGVIVLAVGIVFFVLANRIQKQITSTEEMAEKVVRKFDYRFEDYYVIVKTYRFDEQVAIMKLYYSDCFKFEETGELINVYYNQAAVYPILKATLTLEQLAELRYRFHLSPVV